MITINQLIECIYETRRFVEKAEQARDYLLGEKLDKDKPSITGSRFTGAVRRASLDLSRSLADLRKHV